MSLYTTVLHDVIKNYVCCNLITTPVNTTTPLLRPKYFGRTVVVLTGFHCIIILIYFVYFLISRVLRVVVYKFDKSAQYQADMSNCKISYYLKALLITLLLEKSQTKL